MKDYMRLNFTLIKYDVWDYRSLHHTSFAYMGNGMKKCWYLDLFQLCIVPFVITMKTYATIWVYFFDNRLRKLKWYQIYFYETFITYMFINWLNNVTINQKYQLWIWNSRFFQIVALICVDLWLNWNHSNDIKTNFFLLCSYYVVKMAKICATLKISWS